MTMSTSRLFPILVKSIATFVFAVLCAPQRIAAHTPQSPDPAPVQQQDPAKKDPATATPDNPMMAAPNNPATPKTNPSKPHRVFTNDDFSPSNEMPIAPGSYRLLKRLNRCNKQCFNDVKKQALQFGYTSIYPRSTRDEMDDRLAAYIEDLQGDPKWQKLLLQYISAHLDACIAQRRVAAKDDDTQEDPPTRRELTDEEEKMENYRPPPGSNVNAAGSAVLAYRFSSRPDPLKASLMVHQYMEVTHWQCSDLLPDPNGNTNDDDEDP
jgi:hypothetical protein